MTKRLRLRRPTPAMIIAVIALIAAVSGTAVGAATLTNKAFKNKAVRGPVTYVTTTTPIPANTTTAVSARCPAGFTVTGGGIKWTTPVAVDTVTTDSYPTTTGWGGHVYSGIANTATTIAVCAKSAKTQGTPPTS